MMSFVSSAPSVNPEGALRIFESAVGKPYAPLDLAETVAEKLRSNGAIELLMMAQRELK